MGTPLFNLRNMALQRFGRGQSTQRINRVIVEYRHDPVAGKWLGWQQRDDTTSQGAIGVQERRFTLPLVRDHITAGLIADYHLGYEIYGEQQILFDTPEDCSEIEADSIIIIDRPDLGLSEALFRVTAIRAGAFVSSIEARSFDNAIFDSTTATDPTDPEIDPRIPGTTMENALPVPTLEGSSKPAISEDTYILADGTILTDISVSFTLPADYKYVDHVNIYYRLNGTGSWLKAGETSTEAHVIKALRAVKGQTIQIDARIVNWFGVEGAAGLSDSLELVGKSDLPSDVTGLQAVQSGLGIMLSWNQVEDVDAAGYEVREGASFALGTTIARRVTDTYLTVPVGESRSHSFWVVAWDRSGQMSAVPALATIEIKAPLPVPTLEGSSKPVISEDTYILSDGTILTDIQVSFALPADYDFVDHVNIYYRLNGAGSWLKAGETSTEAHVIKALRAVKGQTIQIDARIVNWSDVEGEAGLSDSLALVGKSALPSDVTGFQATQDGGMIDLIWNHISDLDRRGYEIREGGVAWNEGVPVGVGVAENSWSVPIQEERRYVFRVKATDNSGGESATAAETTITPIILLPKNVIITYDELDLRDGTHTFTAWASSGYTMAHMAGKASDPGFIGEKWSDFPVEVLCIKELEPGVYYPAGDYVSAVRDLGKPVTVKIIPRIIVDATAGTAFQLKFRSSLDNVTWTNWFDAVAQTVTARYLQCRVYLTTSDSSKTPKVRAWLWVVDVPDVDRVGADATVCVGGTEISFGYVYYVPPAVMAMAAGGSRRAEITAKTATGFTVIVVDPDGADVGGTVDWHARGY
jgi:hypothetical protein